nr:udp-galactose/udp-glucose transporter 1 [Quercus suber]
MEIHGDGLRRVLVLAFCVAGIWSAYIYQGFLQETLSTKRFGPDEKSESSLQNPKRKLRVCLSNQKRRVKSLNQ